MNITDAGGSCYEYIGSGAVRLRLLCRERGITVNRLATLSAVTQSTVNDLMRGVTKNVGIVTLKKLIDGLDMTITEFFEDDLFRTLDQEIK